MINIAVDGPAGAGKSTIAKEIAKRLGYIYIDTGAMYRTVGLYALKNNIDTKNSDGRLENALDNISVDIQYIDGKQHMFLNSEDVTDCIRTPAVSIAASDVATVKCVRDKLVSIQRSLAKKADVIMDGRDIASNVLKDAQIKIFLTASVEKRAERRFKELCDKGEKVFLEDIIRDISYRDKNDSERKESPLIKVPDAELIDTSSLTLQQSVDKVYDYIRGRLKCLTRS